MCNAMKQVDAERVSAMLITLLAMQKREKCILRRSAKMIRTKGDSNRAASSGFRQPSNGVYARK